MGNPAVPKRKISRLEKIRKANLSRAIKYRQAAKLTKKKAAQKRADKQLVEQWRALKKLGVYDSKESPAISRLTKTRRESIKKKFNDVQNLARYEGGEAYRPLHFHSYTKPVVKLDRMGRVVKRGTRKIERYELDTDHFQIVKGKPKQKLSDSIKTQKGLLAAKGANEKIKIQKDGTVNIVQNLNAAKTEFSRVPVSGPVEILQLMDDIRAGRLKLNKGEGLQIVSNGIRDKTIYTGKTLHLLLALLERYAGGGLTPAHGGRGKFDNWASNSDIVKRRVR